MTQRIATKQELRDLVDNFNYVANHFRDAFANTASRNMAWTSAQSDKANAAHIYAAIARSL